MDEQTYHIPALLRESIDGLDIKPDGTYADVTFGGGGHSRAIIARLGEKGRLLSFDRDMDAYANRIDDPRFTFIHSDFRYISNFMRYHEVESLDGIIADLGVSFHHFDDASRGFSFRADAPLDMRMNRLDSRSAADIVAEYSAAQLTAIFREFTDLKRPGEVASAIVRAREKAPITTTIQLSDAVASILNPRKEKKDLSQIFQALRIETNGEMESLGKFLLSTVKLLRPGGRLAVLTYHSVEDRIVKNFMKTGNLEGIEEKDFFGRVSTPWKPVTRSPIVPSEEEIERNPRSRSAKLRIAELLPPQS